MKGNTNAIMVTEGAPIGDFKVKVIDYDGTIIDEKYCNLNDEYTLPTPPTHSGLTFQEWNSPYDISNGKIIITNDVIIGAVYVTTSGDTEFDIEVTPASGLTVNFRMNGTRDWGDGTTDSNTSHTYSTYGNYTISCASGSMNTSGTYGLFGQDTSSTDTVGNTTLKAVRFGTGVTQIGQYAFMKCSSLKSVSISKSVVSLGNYSFQSSSNIRAIVLPSTLYNTSTSGNYVGNYAFAYCRELKDIVISKGYTFLPTYFLCGCGTLKEVILPVSISASGFYQYCLANCYALEKVVILGGALEPASYSFYQSYALKDIDTSKFKTKLYQYMFVSNYNLDSELEFTGVSEIDQYLFGGCYNVRKLKFNSNVTTIADNAFYSCKSIEEYDFKANTSVPTLSGTNAFTQINDLCKIKVPWDLYQNWIIATNWSSLTDYIDGGTPATITFTGDITGNTIYVDGAAISGTSTSWVGSSMPYSVYDSTNNTVLPTQTLTGIIEASSQNINIDLSTKNKITLSVGISGLTTTFIIDGKIYNAIEDNGDYYIYVVGSGVSVSYFVSGGTSYTDSSGTISTANQDISIPITLSEATIQSFTRPNLTQNGTLGGNDFAISGLSGTTTYPAYYTMDSNTSTYWIGTATNNMAPRITFYNPNPLCITDTITITTSSNTLYKISQIPRFAGSHDGINYEDIEYTATNSSTTWTVSFTNSKFYKYYHIWFRYNSNGRSAYVYNIALNSVTEKVAAS